MIQTRSAIVIPVTVVAFAAAVLTGCGGGDDNGASEADTQQLTALAEQINEISTTSDAEGFCAILAPSEIKATFLSHARCTKEYRQVFSSIKEPQAATLEDITVDGDTAQLTFEEQDGAVNFVREDGKWWLAVHQGAASDSGSSDEAQP